MLTAAGLSVAIGDLWLVVFCWMRRSVLAGLLGAVGIPVVLFAISTVRPATPDEAVLLIAGIMLVIATALYGLGHWLQQLTTASLTTACEDVAGCHRDTG